MRKVSIPPRTVDLAGKTRLLLLLKWGKSSLDGYAKASEEAKENKIHLDTDLWVKRFISAIERFAPASSNYVQDLDTPRKFAAMERSEFPALLNSAFSTIKALREDYAAGYMRSVAEMMVVAQFESFCALESSNPTISATVH